MTMTTVHTFCLLLGQQAGGMDSTAMALVILRCDRRASKNRTLQAVQREAADECAK